MLSVLIPLTSVHLFLDLTWIYGRDAHYGNVLQHLMTLLSTYSRSPSIIKVTQASVHVDAEHLFGRFI